MAEYSLQPILVGLDLSDMDSYIFSFLQRNWEALTTEGIHFIHVNELDEDLDAEHVSRKVKNKMPEAITGNIHLVKGDAEKEIARYRQSHEISLLLLGHKQVDHHNVEIKRLVRRPTCSLLLVPKKEDYQISKICVALDFSELSFEALKAAEQIASATGASLIGCHSYQVPSGYHKSGKDHKEFAQVMEKNARNEAAPFLKKAGLEDLQIDYLYDEDEKPATCIADYVRSHEIDLLLTGSKGRTGAASILIGSVAKKLTQLLNDVPLMIIKEKNQNMDVVDALKKV